jgi:glucosamine kinase
MAEVLLAGVDGGASKTRAVVLSSSGAVLGAATVQSASAYHREPEEAAGIVLAAVREAAGWAGTPLAAIGAGLAGADDPAIGERLARTITASGLAGLVHVDHDAAAALAGGLGLEPGMVILAGTGSVAFGVDTSGRRARAGGWGPLLDDEGSGYAIGRAVLRAAMRAHDGRGPSTALAHAVQARFALESLAALKATVRGFGIDQVAAVAPLAVEAARAGDAAAARILERAAAHLAGMVAAVAKALGHTDAPPSLVASGGVFEAGDLVVRPMMAALDGLGVRVALRPARFPPEIGAALLAAQAAGLGAGDIARRLHAGPDTAR